MTAVRAGCAILFLPSVSLVASAQQSLPRDTQAVHRWEAGAPGADQLLSDGQVVRSLSLNGIAVAVTLSRADIGMRADVIIANESSDRVDVVPESFTLAKSGRDETVLPYQNPDRLAAAIKRKADIGAAIGMIAGELATQETSVESKEDTRVALRTDTGLRARASASNRSTTTITSPDEVARQRAQDQATQLTSQAHSRSTDILSGALRANTVAAGKDLSGSVYFKRERRHKDFLLRVPVGGIVFEFPLQVP